MAAVEALVEAGRQRFLDTDAHHRAEVRRSKRAWKIIGLIVMFGLCLTVIVYVMVPRAETGEAVAAVSER